MRHKTCNNAACSVIHTYYTSKGPRGGPEVIVLTQWPWYLICAHMRAWHSTPTQLDPRAIVFSSMKRIYLLKKKQKIFTEKSLIWRLQKQWRGGDQIVDQPLGLLFELIRIMPTEIFRASYSSSSGVYGNTLKPFLIQTPTIKGVKPLILDYNRTIIPNCRVGISVLTTRVNIPVLFLRSIFFGQ